MQRRKRTGAKVDNGNDVNVVLLEDEKSKTERLEDALETFKMPVVKFATARNLRGCLMVILGFVFLYTAFLAVFAFIEIQFKRFDESLLFAIIWTVCVTLYLVSYGTLKLVIRFHYDKEIRQMIYNEYLVENIRDQFIIDWVIPFYSLVILLLRWSDYGVSGGANAFTSIDGIAYGIMSAGTFAAAMMIIIFLSFTYGSFFLQPRAFVMSKKRETEIYNQDQYWNILHEKKKVSVSFNDT